MDVVADITGGNPDCLRVRRGTEVEARTARLGLARVSVVRGKGPAAGTPCIDDYIRTLEPVADYLTRFSGLVRFLF